MIPDLNWWGRLLGLLAVEAALIVAVAALLTRPARRPQLRPCDFARPRCRFSRRAGAGRPSAPVA